MPKKPKHVVAEHTNLMEEWDYEKNNKLNIDPTVLGEASHTKAWWKCKKCGFEWETSPHDKKACPNCNSCKTL